MLQMKSRPLNWKDMAECKASLVGKPRREVPVPSLLPWSSGLCLLPILETIPSINENSLLGLGCVGVPWTTRFFVSLAGESVNNTESQGSIVIPQV